MSAILRPAHSVCIDIAPVTSRYGEAVELKVGDRVFVHFDDGLGIESPHKLEGEIVGLFLHNRVKVLIGRTHFSVAADSCELIRAGGKP